MRRQPSRACAPRPPHHTFLSLPPEIRVNVHSLLLHVPHGIDVGRVWDAIPALDLSLFRVNKQISAEATHYFYSTNTFILMEPCVPFCNAGSSKSTKTGEHPMTTWLSTINPTNAHSLRNIHLHLRTERFDPLPPKSNTTKANPGDLLAHLGRSAPNLTRLALVPEAHQKCDAACRPATVTSGATHPRQHSWHHNWVVPLSERQLSIRELVSVPERDWPAAFRGLKVLQIGGKQEREQRDWIAAFLGRFHAGGGGGAVRVQGIEGSVAWRGAFGKSGMLWDEMEGKTRWYDVVTKEDGQNVGGLVVVGDKKKDGKGEE
ncbi:hypothetical protein N658DRAFT_509945 [Parathielavia hyrcaniae]|uniref:F-box domain-containing protein n=1 Tax=Parathielavia hyrcaniae TaxID=113614 RepID=A0AAN6PWQ5_9PEZI|nr:hypothetical protein N658DRAFT_509945 [Parathielavia hyrcaniae]